jgi:diacylglycerol kinase family enzyme
MTVHRRLAVFVNPGAGRGRVYARVSAALARWPELRARAEIVPVASGDRMRAALRAVPEATVPVAAGGDGTVNALVRALREERMGERAIGHLPMGTGNAFAHALGIGRLPAALAALLGGSERAVDIMTTTHPQAPVALVSLSTGFESHVLERQAAGRGFGPVVAAAHGVVRAAAGRWRDVAVGLDGEPFVATDEAVYNVGVYNLRCYAFGKVVNVDADCGDGRAEAIACLSPRAYWRTLARGARLARGTGGDPRVRRWSCAELATPHPIQFDGESAACGRFAVRVERRALRVLV